MSAHDALMLEIERLKKSLLAFNEEHRPYVAPQAEILLDKLALVVANFPQMTLLQEKIEAAKTNEEQIPLFI